MADIKEIDRLARLGVGLVEVQLKLTETPTLKALEDLWSLGYCFGVFDAIARKAKFDQYSDGIALLTVGFIQLYQNSEQGSERLGFAFQQTDTAFKAGNQAGGLDLLKWLSNPEAVPMGLHEHLIASRPA